MGPGEFFPVTNNPSDPISVSVSKVFPVPKWKILRLITRMEYFPRYMPNVKQCTVLAKGAYNAITSWSVKVDDLPLSWKEQDEFDLENFRVRFRAIEGDLECFEGEWRLLDHPQGGTEACVNVRLKIGIPLIEDVIGKVVAQKLRKNFELMLAGMAEVITTKRYKNIHHRRVSDIGGFAVMGHPYNLNHLVKYLKFFKPDFKLPSKDFLVKLLEMTPSYKSYDIKGFRSATGKEINGYFIMCPIVPDMLEINPEKVCEKVVQACRVCEDLGVGIVALGGFTSVAGERFTKSLTSMVNVPLTTGNTLTVALVLEGVYRAARRMDIALEKAKVTVIGGAGDIGGACARLLSEKVSEITITGRNEKNLMETERILSYSGRAKVKTSHDNNAAVRDADIVIAAASASSSIVDFASFKPGVVICDVGYPKNLSYTIPNRDDIFVFSGGLTLLPSDLDLGFDIGLPSTRILYGCFAEAIILDLEERYENYSWGRGNITREKANFIWELAKKHGFELAPFFWGTRSVTEQEIAKIKEKKAAAVER